MSDQIEHWVAELHAATTDWWRYVDICRVKGKASCGTCTSEINDRIALAHERVQALRRSYPDLFEGVDLKTYKFSTRSGGPRLPVQYRVCSGSGHPERMLSMADARADPLWQQPLKSVWDEV